MATKQNLGDRMKGYEDITRYYLINKLPVIIRLDGRAFHSLKLKKPFDIDFASAMQFIAEGLYKEVQNCRMIYSQSDEISLLLFDNTSYLTSTWFENNLQKIDTICSSLASVRFLKYCVTNSLDYITAINKKDIVFDSRAFNIPLHEVTNYFIWRQQDMKRNSIQMLARAHFSQKECHKKDCSKLQDMLMDKKGINWNKTATMFKRGWCYYDGKLDTEIPIFSRNRGFIERFLDTSKI